MTEARDADVPATESPVPFIGGCIGICAVAPLRGGEDPHDTLFSLADAPQDHS